MQAYEPAQLRNVVLMGHSKSGKTTLAEAMLFASGAISRAGRVEDGNTVSDFDAQEHAHGYSISTSLIAVEWNGHRINLLDSPGYADFEGQVISAAAAAETAVITVDGAAGVEAGTHAAWGHALATGVPARMFAITRLDREYADFGTVLDALRVSFGDHVAPLAVPADGLGSVVSLLDEAAPAGLDAGFEAAREMLIEAAADADDDLMVHYLDGQAIGREELEAAVRSAVAAGVLIPVVPVAAVTTFGVSELLDTLANVSPSPLGRKYPLVDDGSIAVDPGGPFVAQVFRTTADPFVGHLSFVKVLGGRLSHGDHLKNCDRNYEERAPHLFLLRGREQIEIPDLCAGDLGAIPKLMHTSTGDVLVAPGAASVARPPLAYPEPHYRSAVQLTRREDVDKLTQALGHFVEQDTTVRVEREEGTGEIILLTLGEVQAGIIAGRLQQEYGVHVELTEPLVPYLETIRGSVRAEYRHKKQTGGRGQFGHVVIQVEPLERGGGFEFQQKVVGGNVPKQYIPAVEDGIREALGRGPLTGSRLVDLRVTLLDGSSHSVDSSEFAFKIAAEQALLQAVGDAEPVLLEPLMRVRVRVPGEFTGDVTALMTGYRGNVVGLEPDGDTTVVEAIAPLAEVQRFGPQLRSQTHGHGRFTMAFDHHAEVPRSVQDQIVSARGRAAAGA